jgi:xanthine/uracil permease
MIGGLFGSASGTTSYSENIAAVSLTRVGSRSVVQCSGVIMVLLGIFTKVSALLASMPAAMVGYSPLVNIEYLMIVSHATSFSYIRPEVSIASFSV